MKKVLVFFGLLIFLIGAIGQKTQAQKAAGGVLPIDGAFERTDIYKRKPTPLPYVREADAIWSKKVWRILDLREKMNQPLYFPTTQMEGKNNLVNLLMAGIKEGSITAYDAKNDDDFNTFTPINYDQAKEAFGATAKKKQVRNVDTGEMEETTVNAEFRSEEIKQIMIKEEWFFDKQTSTLNVRIIGISPIREYYRDEDVNQETVLRQPVFWVYYPEARNLFASNEVFNSQNSARNTTYDDLFLKRIFTSYILKEGNIYNNRSISQYLKGKDAMLESKRIENDLFDYEQNLWEY